VLADGAGVEYSLDELRLWVAVSADCTIEVRKNTEYNYCRASIKKQRKIDRLILLLHRCGIRYTNNFLPSSPGGNRSITFRLPKFYTKEFPIELLTNSTLEQKQVMLDEIPYWDGYHFLNRDQAEYYTVLEENASFVQTLAHLCGMVSNVYSRPNKTSGSQTIHRVSILRGKKTTSWANISKEEVHYDDEYVYCASVPSGMLLIRKDGCISVSGNTDCWAVHQYGMQNVSAYLGKEPSETQIEMMRRHDHIILAVDMDDAGFSGALRIEEALGLDVKIEIVPMPEKDAAACGKEVFLRSFSQRTTMTQFKVALLKNRPDIYYAGIKRNQKPAR